MKTHLEPKFRIQNMELWRQCYFRWLPIVEIQGGGTVQIEMFHRLLLSNVNKLQTALQTQDFEDVPPRIVSPVTLRQSSRGEESDPEIPSDDVAGGITPGQIMPSVNSFFPFSSQHSDTGAELNDILNLSGEMLMDGSVADGLSQMDRDEPYPLLSQRPWALPQPERRMEEVEERETHREHML